MEFTNVDDLLAQLGCKIPEGDVSDDAGAEYTDNEEYVNFVFREIITGKANLDATESTNFTSAPTPPSETIQQGDNQVVGSVFVNPGAVSGLQPNVLPFTVSYLSNGKPVCVLANTVAASGQIMTPAVAVSTTQLRSTSSGPGTAAFMEGNHLEVQNVIDEQSQNMTVVGLAPLVSQPREASAVTTAFTSSSENYIVRNALVTSVPVAQNPSISQSHDTPAAATAVVPASEASSVTPTPDNGENRKRKLYAEPEFKDPVMEKRRRNAQNAKNHREKIKLKIQELGEKLEQTEKEKEELKIENENLKLELARQEEVEREIQALKLENEKLRAREQTLAQQEKLGFVDFDLISDLFK